MMICTCCNDGLGLSSDLGAVGVAANCERQKVSAAALFMMLLLLPPLLLLLLAAAVTARQRQRQWRQAFALLRYLK